MTSPSTLKLLALASTLVCAAGAWAADYTWNQNASGEYDLIEAANWTATEGLPTGVAPCETNTVAFAKDMKGDIKLTASRDLKVKNFTFNGTVRPLNLTLDLGLNDSGEPRIWQATSASSLCASNLTFLSGRFIVTNGNSSLWHFLGGKVVVDGSNTIIEAPNDSKRSNYLNFDGKANRSLIFQNGAKFKGNLIPPYTDGTKTEPVTGHLLCFTGAGTQFNGNYLTLGRGHSVRGNTCIVEAQAVVNVSILQYLTQAYDDYRICKDNKFLLRDQGVVNAGAFSSSGHDNLIDVTNATLNVSGTMTLAANRLDVWKDGFVNVRGEFYPSNNGEIFVHKGGKLIARKFALGYRASRAVNSFCCVDGGCVVVTNILEVGFYDDGNKQGHFGHQLLLQNNASMIVTNSVGEGYARFTSVGYNSGDSSLVITNNSSLVIRGPKAVLEVGFYALNRGSVLPSNNCVRVHQSLLDCAGDIYMSSYRSQFVFDDAIVTGKSFNVGVQPSFNHGTPYASNCLVRVSGAATEIHSQNNATIKNNSILVFDIPQTGFKQVPFVAGGTITIDPSTKVEIDGKAYQKLSGAPVALMTAEQGFGDGLELVADEKNANKFYVTNLSLTLNGEAATDAHLYVLKDGESKETLYAKLPVLGGTVIIVR